MVTRKQEKLFSFRKLFFIHIFDKKMILETVSASLLTGVVAAVGLSFVRNEPLPSLQVDEHGKRNPMLPYWVVLSIVHVGIVYAWAYCMGGVFHLIRLRDEVFDVWWESMTFIGNE